jgi:hypothetical protein
MSIFDDINLFGSSVDQLLAQKKEKTDITRDLAEKHGAKLPYFAAQFAPGMGIKDAVGEMPGLPPTGAELTDIFSAPNEPSMAENIRSGGLDRYLIAPLQGLGVLGDAAYGIPYAGPVIGAGLKLPGALAAVAGGIGKAKKGITALDETKRMLKADVDAFARDDTGFVSPTIKALIEKAPANLKGKQITEWLNANANKGVKPKELEYLGFDDYLAANPTATVREAVQGVSGNKVKVTRTSAGDTSDNAAPLLEFDVQDSLADPLDGSKPWAPKIEEIKYDLENMTPADESTAFDLLEIFAGANPSNPAKNLDEVETFLKSKGESLDDLIEKLAESRYMDNPYKMIQPMTRIGDPTYNNYDNLPGFAYGNDDVGYQLFVNGERVTDVDNVAYSQTEAQIQLRNKMQEELGTDPFRIQGEDDFYFDDEIGGTNYKNFVDESLPGGDNYRQVLFRWENAPKGHNATDHFDDPQAIAHALVRDRKLADGTDSLHVDELQSDIHTAGSKYGYDTPETFNKLDKEFENLYGDYIEKYEPFQKKMRQGLLDMIKRYPNENGPKKLLERFDVVDTKISRAVDPNSVNYFDAHQNLMDFIYNNNLELTLPAVREFLDDLVDGGVDISQNIVSNLTNNRAVKRNLVPNYPFKDDWHNMSLQQLVLDAIENGKDTISVSGSVPMIERYSDKYATFYETLYDKKIPSAMKKLANKYGGKFETGKLDTNNTFKEADPDYLIQGERYYDVDAETLNNLPLTDANILRITPEMKAKVLEEGFPGFALGGEVSTKGIKALRFKKIVMPKEEDRGIGSL